jgi:hypothetical protein
MTTPLNDVGDIRWPQADATLCPICGREACDEHYPPDPAGPRRGLTNLQDAAVVIAEGKHIAAAGIRYTVDGIIPAYGMLGMLVAYAKVGKTTLGQALAGAVAEGQPFLDRETTQTRVLVIAAEDPPEYTAYLARHLTITDHHLTFSRAPLLLNSAGLRAISETIEDGHFGLVLIASWQAVIRGLVKDENDNAGAVQIVEVVKAAARTTDIPWLIDAHAGKSENQDDDADPTKALRGASGAAGAADYLLSLRYANGAFGTQRRLSGKGRFVSLAPLTLDYDPLTGAYTCLGDTKDAANEITWRQLIETQALDQTPRGLTELARRCGYIPADQRRLTGGQRRHLSHVLARPDVGRADELQRGVKVALYHLLGVM